MRAYIFIPTRHASTVARAWKVDNEAEAAHASAELAMLGIPSVEVWIGGVPTGARVFARPLPDDPIECGACEATGSVEYNDDRSAIGATRKGPCENCRGMGERSPTATTGGAGREAKCAACGEGFKVPRLDLEHDGVRTGARFPCPCCGETIEALGCTDGSTDRGAEWSWRVVQKGIDE